MSSRCRSAVQAAVVVLTTLLLCPPAQAGDRLYVSNATSDALVVVDVDTRATLATIPVGADPERVSVSADGSRAYVVVLNTDSPLDNTVAIVDTASFSVLGSVPVGNYPRRIVVSPDGARAYVANYGADITVIDTVAGTALTPISAPQNLLMDVATSPDGMRLYWSETGLSKDPWPGALVVADTSGAVLNRIANVYDPDDITIAGGGTKAYVTDTRSGGFTAVDLPADSSPTKIGGSAGFEAINIAVTPDGARLYVADSGLDVVTVRDVATDAVVTTIPVTDPGSISVTPDGASVIVASGAGAGAVTVIDAATNTVAGTLPLGAGGTYLATGPAPTGPVAPVAPAPAVLPLVEQPPPPPAQTGASGTVATAPWRTVRRTVRLRSGCTTVHLRVAGRGVTVTRAQRLAGKRCRVTLRVARSASGRRDLLVKRGRRSVRLRGLIRL